MPRFSNKVAIITGSSNGIGRATAIILAKDGAKVTITGRNAERLEETRQQLLAAGISADNINAVVADITSSDGRNQLINSTIQKFGQLDILINNAGAGFNDPTGVTGIRQSIELFDKTINVNLKSVIELTQLARPYLEKTQGDIVNVSSIASGPQAHASFSYYSMAKAALDQFSRNAAIELIEHGIRVNCVNPGAVDTGFMGAMDIPDAAKNKVYDFMLADKHSLPVRKMGKPEDIGHLIAFLADKTVSSYIIGQTITADGGTTLINAMNSHDFVEMLLK
ncbi:unnamed protein product [Caenorhabditis angaria]|uniref:Uncharacterized protein n=1 Tax=Caenorhabditis angaria TaxID=860376 RepID=A0A9P1MVX8_9PELO|nr:unnamed protein product [Caenorhabditis angaria]